MRLLALIALTLSFVAQAHSEEIYCDVASLKDAKACMKKWAKAYPQYEEPNDAFASTDSALLVEILKALDVSKSAIRQAVKADYVGAILVHEDEHHIIYYSLQKGKGVSPREVYDLNTVDLSFLLGDKIRGDEAAVAAQAANYFLGEDSSDLDVVSDLEEQIAEALAGH